MSNQNNQNDSSRESTSIRPQNNQRRVNTNQYVNNSRTFNPRGSNSNRNDQFDYNNRNNQRSYQRNRTQPQQPDQLEETIRQKQSRLISISSSTGNSINCICCLHELDTYAYYSCQHYVCLKCAIKMRILCQKIDCPVCRQESKSILCTKKPIEDDKKLEDLIKMCPNYSRPIKLNPIPSCAEQKTPEIDSLPNAGINFESDAIKEEYNEIISSKCNECGDLFRDFDQLDQHMRKIHRQFYCELCLENLKLFPYERKYYNREELAVHKRHGDNTGEFKGHPLCHYCDNRFYDRDDLYRHFRKEHYFCHFCDSDGHEEYYKDYSELRNHFLQSHYLCEMDKCSFNAAETHEYVVFRNALDLQAHKYQFHAKTKSDLKNYGKINIEFNVNRDRDRDRERERVNNRNQRNNQQRANNTRNRNNPNTASNNQESTDEYEEETLTKAPMVQSEIKAINEADFPSVQKIREEEEEKKKKQLEITTKQQETASKPTTSNELIDEKQILPATESSGQQSQWRNLISQGNAPKLNQEAEFPSLASTVDTKTAFPSLSEFGFKSALGSNVTVQPLSKRQAKKEKKITAAIVQPVAAAPVPPPPPGFSSIVQPKVHPTKVSAAQSTVPPGFSSGPPGFESKAINKPVVKSNIVSYIKPDNYDARNEVLSIKLKNLFGIFDENEYQLFKNLSIEFRQNKIDAKSYLTRCRSLLDGPLTSVNYINKENLETINSHLKFIDLIQEMIVLLPDITKQNELYKAFIEYIDNLKSKIQQPEVVPQQQQQKKVWSKKVAQQPKSETKQIVNQLLKCDYCNQFILENEYSSHQSKQHDVKVSEPVRTKLDAEYPSLAATVVKSQPTEDFPALSGGIINTEQTRFSSMPTTSLFANPSSHLSLVNRKKHRLQK